MDKAIQRKRALAKRAAISSESAAQKAAAAIERVKGLREFESASTIFAYRALRDELDISALCDHAISQNKRVAYPVCDGRGGMLAAIPADCEPCNFQCDKYGIVEPCLVGAQIIPPGEIDFVLAPGVAFDHFCGRIGWGGGYYDRFLPLCKNAFVCALAFEEQVLDDRLCADPWDRPMDVVVTDASAYFSFHDGSDKGSKNCEAKSAETCNQGNVTMGGEERENYCGDC